VYWSAGAELRSPMDERRRRPRPSLSGLLTASKQPGNCIGRPRLPNQRYAGAGRREGGGTRVRACGALAAAPARRQSDVTYNLLCSLYTTIDRAPVPLSVTVITINTRVRLLKSRDPFQ
jgi:hypothetical protein